MSNILAEGIRVSPSILKNVMSKHGSDFFGGFELEYIMEKTGDHRTYYGDIDDMSWDQMLPCIGDINDSPSNMNAFLFDKLHVLEDGTFSDEYQEWYDAGADEYEHNVRTEFSQFDDLSDTGVRKKAIAFLRTHEHTENPINDDAQNSDIEDRLYRLMDLMIDGQIRSSYENQERHKYIDDYILEKAEEISIEDIWNSEDFDRENIIDELNIEMGEGFERDGTEIYQSEDVDDNSSRFGKELEHVGEVVGIPNIDDWSIVHDNSIHPEVDEVGFELVSPVMELTDMLMYLPKCLDYISSYGHTNDTCGVHISLSFKPETGIDNIDWVKLAVLSGDKWMLKQFDRAENEYAVSQIDLINKALIGNADLNNTPIGDLINKLNDSELLRDKYSSFNIKDFEKSGGRIEFRIIGSRGYEDRTNDIISQIYRYVMYLVIASDDQLYRREYYKKLSALINKRSNEPTRHQLENNPYYKAWERRYPIIKNFDQKNSDQYIIGYIGSLVARERLSVIQTESTNPALERKLMLGLMDSLGVTEKFRKYVSNWVYIKGYSEIRAANAFGVKSRSNAGFSFNTGDNDTNDALKYAYFIANPDDPEFEKKRIYTETLSFIRDKAGSEIDVSIRRYVDNQVADPISTPALAGFINFSSAVIMRYGHIDGIVENVLRFLGATGQFADDAIEELKKKLPDDVVAAYFEGGDKSAAKNSPIVDQAVNMYMNGNLSGRFSGGIAMELATGLLIPPVNATLIPVLVNYASKEIVYANIIKASRNEAKMKPEQLKCARYWNTFITLTLQNIDNSNVSVEQKDLDALRKMQTFTNDAIRYSS